MINIEDKKCTACGACVQKCPQKCLFLRENSCGFLYPYVDKLAMLCEITSRLFCCAIIPVAAVVSALNIFYLFSPSKDYFPEILPTFIA